MKNSKSIKELKRINKKLQKLKIDKMDSKLRVELIMLSGTAFELHQKFDID